MSRLPSAAHLAAWAGVAPAIHESAGKRSPAGARHGNTWLDHMLVEAAGSVARVKGANHLSAQHARLTARCGMGREQVAVAHSILVSAYYMFRDDEPYRELGADWLARRNTETHIRRPVPQIEHLGHTVILDPVASPDSAAPDGRRAPPARADARPQLSCPWACVALDLVFSGNESELTGGSWSTVRLVTHS
jgi:hypothetical protein